MEPWKMLPDVKCHQITLNMRHSVKKRDFDDMLDVVGMVDLQ